MDRRQLEQYQDQRVREMIGRGVSATDIETLDPTLTEAVARVARADRDPATIEPEPIFHSPAEIREQLAIHAAAHPEDMREGRGQTINLTSDHETVESAVDRLLATYQTNHPKGRK